MQAEQPIEDIIKNAFLNAYPNPQRLDCPGSVVLKRLAGRHKSKDVDWTAHMTHCSPCTREFLEFRREWQRNQTRRRLAFTAATAIAAVLLFWLLLPVSARLRPMNVKNGASSSSTVARLDYHDPRLRGLSTSPRQIVSMQTDELHIILPKGAETGSYSVGVQRPTQMGRNLASFAGQATVGVDGLVTIRAKVNFSKFAPGEYLAEWRHEDNENYGSFFISR